MAVWNPWYQYPIYLGAFLVLIGAGGLWYGAHDKDTLRMVIGASESVIGLILVSLGALMRTRYRKGEKV